MKTIKLLFPVLTCMALISACSNDSPAQRVNNIKTEVAENIDSEMNQAISEINKDMKDISIDLKNGGKAIITENGDLSIDGKAVSLNAEQRALSKSYFDTMKQIALQGVEIGKQSAKLATQAIGLAIGGMISGDVNEAEIEKKVEAKAGSIEAVAQKLCDSASQLQSIQEQLIKAVPEFNPEPIEVEKNNDGCNVNAGSHININTATENEDRALDASEAPPPASK